MHVLGLIPARGGSRGIPRKNLVPLLGRPLVAYTCDAAQQAKELTTIVCSTDDDEIAGVVGRLGIDVHRRPDALAADDTPMLDVLCDVLDGVATDVVVLLQPTSPLRRASHIDEAVRLWQHTGADAVVSVVPVPHAFTPGSLLREEDGLLVPDAPGPPPTRRQDKPRLLARNGPAILVVAADTLRAGLLYGDRCVPYLMDERDSIDVDNEAGLAIAEALLAARATTR